MLRVELRRLAADGTETVGVLAPDDPVFEGTTLVLAAPVEVSGRLRRAEADNYVWQGHIRARITGECRRCLGDVEQEVDESVSLLFSADPELEEDPSVYPLPADPSTIDLAVAVREELVLRASAFPLCSEDCKGLCPTCGADLNAGPCQCAVSGTNN
jgi:uncharacterized protein